VNAAVSRETSATPLPNILATLNIVRAHAISLLSLRLKRHKFEHFRPKELL
jgi:hypothetical protein